MHEAEEIESPQKKRKHAQDIFACMTKEERNEAIGTAIDAWLDSKWMQFSKWTMRGILAALMAGLMHLIATHWR